jgi:hypothetical protein
MQREVCLRTIVSDQSRGFVTSTRGALNKALNDYHIAVAVLRAAGLAREKAMIDKKYALHRESVFEQIDCATTVFDEKESAKQAALTVLERAVADFHGEYTALQVEASVGRWACGTGAISALEPSPLVVGRRTAGDYAGAVVAQSRELLHKHSSLMEWKAKL